jgi:hypothetical protein
MHAQHIALISTALLVPTLALSDNYGRQGTSLPDRVSGFEESIAAYTRLHHAVEAHVEPLEISQDARKIHQAVTARQLAIQQARAGAMPGDIFTSAVSDAFRDRIRAVLREHGRRGFDLWREMAEDMEAFEPPTVNGVFSWATATATPPCILAVLPPLPDELQYRFVGASLVLVDIEANLIVDVLPGVIDATNAPPAHDEATPQA